MAPAEYPSSAVERAMKVQWVSLRAIDGHLDYQTDHLPQERRKKTVDKAAGTWVACP